MKTEHEPFNTGDSTLDEMLELKRGSAAEHGFDLSRIYTAIKSRQKSAPDQFAHLREQGRRKVRELQQLAQPTRA